MKTLPWRGLMPKNAGSANDAVFQMGRPRVRATQSGEAALPEGHRSRSRERRAGRMLDSIAISGAALRHVSGQVLDVWPERHRHHRRAGGRSAFGQDRVQAVWQESELRHQWLHYMGPANTTMSAP